MADQKIGAANIEVGVTSTVPQDLEASKKSLKDFANVTRQAGEQVQQSMKETGESVAKMEVSSENLNKTQRRTADSIIRSAQRLSSDTKAAYLDWVASQAGVTNATQAARDKLRQWEAGQTEAVSAGRKYIQMLKEQTETIGMNRREMLQYQAAQLGVSDQAAPFINKMFDTSKAFTSVEMSAKQTRQAMRMLPAQITDVVTSLASGMPMYLVAIQQGGQLRDSFGGFGNVLRGVAALISPTALAIAGLAAVGGATYIAYESAASIMREFERLLISSGNSAGLTSSQLSSMAKEISSITGTQKQASGALNAIISSNSLLGQSYTAIAAASLSWSKATGESVDKVIEKFVSLAKDPGKAMEELDGQFNFLTVSTYEQVTALVEQGRKADASRILIEALSNTMTERAPQMIEQTNAFARAWDTVASSAKKAFESLGQALSAPTLQQEYNDALKTYFDLNKQLEDLQNSPTMNVLREEEARQLQQLIENQKTYLSSINDEIMAQAKLAEESRKQAEAKKNLNAINTFLREGMTAEEKVQGQINILVEQYVALLKIENLTKLQKLAIDSAMAEQVNKIWEGYLKQIDTGKGVVKTTKDVNEEIRKQIENYRFETDLLIMNTQERERAKFIRDMESKGIEENSAAWRDNLDAFNAAMMERMQQQSYVDYLKRDQKAQQDSIKERLKSEEKYAKQVEKINDQIGQSLTDALMRGGMNAKDFLINMFKTMILRPILQPIITGFAGALGIGAAGAALAGDGTAAGSSAMGQASGLLGLASAAKTAYQFVTGGFEAIGSMASTIASTFEVAANYGTGLLSQQTAMLAAQEAGISTFSATAGLAAQYLAGIGAGVMAGQMISGDYKVGGSSYLATGGGAIIGAIVGGPLGAAIGGAIGGVINRAFGMAPKKTTSAGYDLTLSAAGAITTGFEKWEQKGGWFRSSRSGKEITAVAQETIDFFNNSALAVSASVAGMSKMFGASLDNINNFSLDIVIETLGATKEQIEEQIGGAFKYMETSLVDFLIPSIYEFATASDKTASDILKRLANSISGVNQAFEVLGYNLYEVSLQSASAASKLVDLFGGLENFAKTTTFYYENFYSAQEKINFQTEQLTKIFSSFGLVLPESNAAFRQLVETVQAAGNDQLFATLVQLAPAFNTLQKAMEQVSSSIIQQRTQLTSDLFKLIGDETYLRAEERKAIDESNLALFDQINALKDAQSAMNSANAAVENALSDLESSIKEESKKIEDSIQNQLNASLESLKNQFDSLTENINEQISTLQTQKQVASETLNGLRSIFNFLSDQVRDITGLMQPAQVAAQGLAFVAQAVRNVQATGYLPDPDELRQAVNSARTGLGGESFGSAFEMRRANLQFANQLTILADVAATQSNSAEDQIEKADEQIELLRLQLEQAKQQYDQNVINERNFYNAQLTSQQAQLNALLGVNSGVLSVSSAIQALAIAMNAQSAASAALLTQSQQQAAAATTIATTTPTMTSFEQSVNDTYQRLLGRTVDVAGLQYWKGTGQNISQIESNIKLGSEYREVEIKKMYRDILGREADASGLAYWLNDKSTLDQIRQNLMLTKAAGQFAEGGFYPGGMALVGEEGPELINFNRPGQVYTASETRDIMSSSADSSNEIRQLREENRAQSRAMVALQARMTRILEQWDGDGIPTERYEGATA